MPKRTVLLVASGDLRLSANQQCWPAQAAMEKQLTAAVARLGFELVRAHPYKPKERHGFIASQKEGMEVFATLDPKAPLIVAESVWQYSHHVLAGLISHRGPILTAANWSGTWPGLVGMLNLNGSLTKAGVAYSTLWSEDFTDELFTHGLATWLKTGRVVHPTTHVRPLAKCTVPAKAATVARRLAQELRTRKAILGVFDEGCMGMFNAIIPDELLFSTGVFKERLSQSALYYAATQVPEDEARTVYEWLQKKGLKFHLGHREATELTEDQVLWQCRTYIAALRIADEFGCDAIGIQYQQGLKDLLPASDLVEGLLNNSDRPPVRNAAGRVIRAGEPLPHFNEVDECAGLDGLLTHRVHRALGQPVENTLHDLRWGDVDRSGSIPDYVWVFLISGATPPAHHVGGYKGSDSHRQPAMYFRLGGGTLRGVAKPGEIVWSRIFVEAGKLKMDLGRARAVALPREETERRWKLTTPQWPIMHAVTYGVSRDQMMARHKANHIQVAYARSAREADLALYTKAALARELGLEVALCGTRADGSKF
ncbi:fucose isomerase [Opitutus terrae]|uniref:Putative L-fucose isomerase n=1 Tax=Opitutus terrae (strain DSM 11246 / JCM 15787 / PB90-1) TaxID=452637 RepID=B1ZTE3_OPITP|nr:fucose isomerase [Opitutus terrae]ACB76597.1 putative L-fucose isomerase [Opitutus terrae PB90-1]